MTKAESRTTSLRLSMTCLVVIALCFFSVFHNNVSSISSLGVEANAKTKSEVAAARRGYDLLRTKPRKDPMTAPISCDRSHGSYDICSIYGPNVLDPTKSTFYAYSPTVPPVVEKLRPYPRKSENHTMARIKEITLISTPMVPKCEVKHDAPAFVFSAGGYTGNVFHDFNDGFIPLFITVNLIFPDHDDIVLVVATGRDWWVNKYKDLLRVFTKHPIIGLEHDTSTHCFTNATIGLVSHGFMTIDPKLMPTKKTFTHFRALLARAYGPAFAAREKTRPQLVWVTRPPEVGRGILNLEEAKNVASDVGFDVVMFEPKPDTSLRESYKLISSSHVMIGVHGAGLTHFMFLRSGSVFMQVVPLGTSWASGVCFGKAARDTGLEYIEYRIGINESTLVDKYGENNTLVKNPSGAQNNGWPKEVMDIYLKEQNVKLDLGRFRVYLEKAHEQAKKLMYREG